MANKKGSGRRTRPGTTLETRENELISLASDLAEKQLREGTASSQVMTHFLKLGTTREKLEKARIEHEILLLSSKYDAMQSASKMESLMVDALTAMREYKGEVVPYEDDFDGTY